MLIYHICEYLIDEQECNGILNIVSGVKINFDWKYATYVTNFKAFFIMLNNLNNTS